MWVQVIPCKPHGGCTRPALFKRVLQALVLCVRVCVLHAHRSMHPLFVDAWKDNIHAMLSSKVQRGHQYSLLSCKSMYKNMMTKQANIGKIGRIWNATHEWTHGILQMKNLQGCEKRESNYGVTWCPNKLHAFLQKKNCWWRRLTNDVNLWRILCPGSDARMRFRQT